MEHVNLGSTGLKVSRLCLGTMTYGSRKWRPWVLEEKESRPFIRQAIEAGINFFDTADMYSLGASEEISDAPSRNSDRRGPPRHRHQGFQIPWATTPISGDSHGNTFFTQSTTACAGWERTMWIYTRSIGSIRPLRSKRLWRRSTTSSAPARRVSGGVVDVDVAVRADAFYAERHDWTRFVTMQNHYNLLYREEEREMIPLCRAEGIGVIPGVRWRGSIWREIGGRARCGRNR